MKLKKVISMTAVAVTGVMLAGQPVMAATVSEDAPEQEAQQTVVLEKTEEVVPTYTVDVPAKVVLSKDAQDLSFSLNLENHDNFIPDGKKVSVVIESAGYPPTELDKFAVWTAEIFRKHLMRFIIQMLWQEEDMRSEMRSYRGKAATGEHRTDGLKH